MAETSSWVRLKRAGRVVQEHADRTQLGQLSCLLDQGLGLPGRPAAVEQARVELLLGVGDRLPGLAQVLDVVQRVVEPEDVDPALRSAGDETPGEVSAHRSRTDQEAPTEREPQRCRRAPLQRPDPLPGAFDAAADGAVEDAATGDLEVREARAVENLGQLEDRGSRDAARERLL